MKRPLLIIILLTSIQFIFAQDNFRISKPELSFSNNILTIRYDITGCGSGDYLDIRLIILGSKGDTIRPSYISGDLGKRINCGLGKTISWNVAKDNIKTDEDFEVLIQGIKSVLPSTSVSPQVTKRISRGNVVISSVFIPGLGQKKASGKSLFLVFTGLVYGVAGSSIYMNIKSKNIYKDYQAATGIERDNLYNNSINTFNTSQYLLYGAAGLWAINFIWSAVIPIKENPLKKMNVSLTSYRQNEIMISAKWNF